MGLGIPLLKIKIVFESNPLKSIMLVGRLAVLEQRSAMSIQARRDGAREGQAVGAARRVSLRMFIVNIIIIIITMIITSMFTIVITATIAIIIIISIIIIIIISQPCVQSGSRSSIRPVGPDP